MHADGGSSAEARGAWRPRHPQGSLASLAIASRTRRCLFMGNLGAALRDAGAMRALCAHTVDDAAAGHG